MAALDIQALVEEFVADPKLSSTELPHMTTGQRKHTKRILEGYPELKCESYGFGPERKLHIFKVTDDVSSAAGTEISSLDSCATAKAEENTEISSPDGCATTEIEEGTPIQSLPSKPPGILCKSTVRAVMDGPVCKLDLTSIKEATHQVFSAEGSTAAPSPCPSDASPASTFREMPPWFRLPPGLELEVHNTFIHYKSPPVDQRAVQSMPHCMFKQCLLAEAANANLDNINTASPADVARASLSATSLQQALQTVATTGSFTVGMEVVIEGLSKCPAFNGVRGTVQSWDEQSGRYNILFLSPVCGHTTAKVKRENIRSVPASESLNPSMDHPEFHHPLRLSALC